MDYNTMASDGGKLRHFVFFLMCADIFNSLYTNTKSVVKANMNSYILLQMAAIFFSIEPLSQTGYCLGVCYGWFHLQGLTGGVKNASRVRITKLKIPAHCGIRTRVLPFTKRARYHWATKADVRLADKTSPGFTCAIFRNLPVARVRCSKIICRLFLSYDICIVLLFTN